MGTELGSIRFEENGDVTLFSGTHDHGQGHQTAFAQIVVDKLGVPFERIRLDQSDSDLLPGGGGTGGSRSIMAGGTAIISTLDKVIERGKLAAAALLEAGAQDIEFAKGRFTIAGTDRSIGITDLAARLRKATNLPADVPRSLDHAEMSTPIPGVFPNGCHIAEIEIDPQTGEAHIDRYVSVNDFGTVVNPMLVEGQIHGGAVQGLGQALMEDALYDAEGQLRTGSFMDYAMPRAADTPSLRDSPPPGSDEDECGRRQGVRRSRMLGVAAGRRERRSRCALRSWHTRDRHAGNAPSSLVGDPGRETGVARGRAWQLARAMATSRPRRCRERSTENAVPGSARVARRIVGLRLTLS